MDERVNELFNERKNAYKIEFDLKEEQIRTSLSVLNKRNVVGLLPTRFGKTFCMVIPSIVKMEKNPITLVVSPLTSLIEDHISSLRQWNFKCAKISSLTDMDEENIAGKSNDLQPNFPFLIRTVSTVWLTLIQ